ncbi:glycosyltransferase family 39 protein [Aerosakkonema funiforme]|uniref:Glycosyltransferase family 39 protein n=1 Tax=Aerosakkonema funiforme FACHB-1375 TaxID=2949571 RepID=A0A926VF10_9CYAN|nr:glycosyltransferase family 39 protein [Aerosakkonema funiforme]MBD2182614.1 glycosyltransferase family 39 protein [Aerosakkonema funiforme FACHB-1375]
MRNSSLILIVWFAIGTWLRFTNLELKSPWTDEFSTMVFSLGNSFRNVPLDRAIALDVLMSPLIPKDAGTGEVVQHLLSESNHPPLYFVLAHLWMKLFPQNDGLISLWVARSLPAILGAASIPAMYALGYIAARSRLVGHLAAAMMAVSPYGIFLAQEARHYTLAILFAIASLACLLIAVRHIEAQKPLSFWFSISWIAINTLGIASHYFFVFTLLAEALVLLAFLLINWRTEHRKHQNSNSLKNIPKTNYENQSKSAIQNFKSLIAVAITTLLGGLIWLPVWQHNYNSELTAWIKNSDRVGWEWINPIFQLLAAWITMLSLLPVEVTSLPIVIASGLVMIIFFIWVVPLLIRGIKKTLTKAIDRQYVLLFSSFVTTSIVLFLIVTYGFGIDLTRGARYNFVYFPAVILLVGASLAEEVKSQKLKVKIMNLKSYFYLANFQLAIILLMGFLSALTVTFNMGYQKYYRPDLLVPVIQKNSQYPIAIATTHKTHVQTGEMMGLGWEFQHLSDLEISKKPLFILAHQDNDNSILPTTILQKALSKLPRPLDLWLVNFQAPQNVKAQNCFPSSQTLPFVDGYDYQLYRCN